MISKSLVFTTFLLISWSLFVKYQPFSLSQHQWQGNIINAEKFMFDIDSLDNLILGSSLAQRLLMDSLPGFYNLSLGGQGIFDGLNILRHKKYLPKNVFIEINFLDRGEDSNFKEIVSSPIINTLKSNSSIFRADKHPLAYFGNRFMSPLVDIFFWKIVYKIRYKVNLESSYNEVNIKTNLNNTFFDKMLALRKEMYLEDIDPSKGDIQFEILASQVKSLESKGIKVIFFEMPVNPQLVELTRANYLRNRVIAEYPDSDFIRLPSNLDYYKTSDGIHLTKEESIVYTFFFKREAGKYQSDCTARQGLVF